MSIAKSATLLLLMSACVGEGQSSDEVGTSGEEPPPSEDVTNPVDQSEPEAGLDDVARNYQLHTRFQLTAGSLSPEPAVELLNQLNEDPGQVIVTLAEAAGVPAAGLLFDALPETLSGRLAGWIGEAVADNGLVDIQVLMAWSQLVLAEVDVESALTIGDFDSGVAQAEHILQSIHFQIDGSEIEEEIPQIAALPGAGHSELEVSLHQDAEGLTMHMSEQRFGLLFGEAAYRAVQSLVLARYGTDMRGLLGEAIDCEAVALEVSQRCVLGVCVGHQDELLQVCEGALDEAIEKVHQQFYVLDAEVLRLRDGQARVRLAEAGGTELVSGSFHAAAELGQGLRDLPATFRGSSYSN